MLYNLFVPPPWVPGGERVRGSNRRVSIGIVARCGEAARIRASCTVLGAAIQRAELSALGTVRPSAPKIPLGRPGSASEGRGERTPITWPIVKARGRRGRQGPDSRATTPNSTTRATPPATTAGPCERTGTRGAGSGAGPVGPTPAARPPPAGAPFVSCTGATAFLARTGSGVPRTSARFDTWCCSRAPRGTAHTTGAAGAFCRTTCTPRPWEASVACQADVSVRA